MGRQLRRVDIYDEMSAQPSRLTRYLYETRLAFLFAAMIVVLVVAAFGLRAHAGITCATESIAAGSAGCASSAPADQPPAAESFRLVFQSAQ